MFGENEKFFSKVQEIRNSLTNHQLLIIGGLIPNTDGKEKAYGIYAAPQKPFYGVRRWNALLNSLRKEVPDSKRGVYIRQGQEPYSSIRFGYLYVPGETLTQVHLYPDARIARAVVDYHQSRALSQEGNRSNRLEILTHGMTESDLVSFKKDPTGFLNR